MRAAAEEAERASQAPQHMIDPLHTHGLFRLWIPHAFGGDALPLPASLRAFEEAARLDGSIGFLVMIGVGGGLFGRVMQDEVAAEVFGPPDALVAGSGAPHATRFTANYVLTDTPTPVIWAMTFPAAAVTIEPTWEVSGLRATASHSFSVRNALVPAGYTFSVFTDSPRQPEPLYRYPFGSIAQLAFASVALGIGRHAIDEFAAAAPTHRLARARTTLQTDPAATEAYA